MMTTIQELRNNFNTLTNSTKSTTFTNTYSKWFGDYIQDNFDNDEVMNSISDVYFEWCSEMDEEDLFEDTCDYQDEFKYVFLNYYQKQMG